MIVAPLAGLATQLNPSQAQLKNYPGTGTASTGRQMLADVHISPGVMKPLNVLVGAAATPPALRRSTRSVPGIVRASAPCDWRRGPESSAPRAHCGSHEGSPGPSGPVTRMHRE